MEQKRLIIFLSVITFLVFIWSLIKPVDYFVWLLESFPALIAVPILIFTYKKFKFTNLVYTLIAMHIMLLLIGGHYTYAENPLFNWIKVYFHLTRNYYDRLGHFFQGLVPALVLREFLLKLSPLKKGKLLILVILSIVLAISASYELFEWWTAVSTSPGTGNAFLGTQGDIWDTQWDMLMALIGGISALLFFSKLQDSQLKTTFKYK